MAGRRKKKQRTTGKAQYIFSPRPPEPSINNSLPCKICGTAVDWLSTHLRYAHKMSVTEYVQMFPCVEIKAGSDIWSKSGQRFFKRQPTPQIEELEQQFSALVYSYGR